MRRVLVSNAAHGLIDNLRSSTGGYEAVKCQIADSLSNLAKMLNNGMDYNEELHYYVNDIVEAMGLVADYNELVDKLSDRRDVNLSHYVLERPADDDDERQYDYALNERDIEVVEKILEEKEIKLPGILTLDEMTLSEIADAAGMTNEDLHKMVSFRMHGLKAK